MPTILTMHETKLVAQHLQFGGKKAMFISRAYSMNRCPYVIGAGLDLVAHNTKQIVAKAIIRSIRPVMWKSRSKDRALAVSEGFTNEIGWTNHWISNYGLVPEGMADSKKVFRIQLEILPNEKKLPDVGDML